MRAASIRSCSPSALIGACLFVTAAPASAHPLGNFTVNRYTGVLISPDGVAVDHVVDLAEIPTAQLGTALDDLPALAASECATTAAGLDLGQRASPYPSRSRARRRRPADGEGGLPITRISCSYTGTADIGAGEVTFEDRTAPGSVGWREITAVGNGMTLSTLGRAVRERERPPRRPIPRTSSSPRSTSPPPLSSSLPVGRPASLPGDGAEDPSATDGSWLVRTGDVLARRRRLAGGGPRAPRRPRRSAPPMRSRRATARP